MAITLSNNDFTRAVSDFLCGLRDSYGFNIDCMAICKCICAAADITDSEEVEYRMQSLVCKSEEEIAVFREQFEVWHKGVVCVSQAELSQSDSELKSASNNVRRLHDTINSVLQSQKNHEQEISQLERQLKRNAQEIEQRTEEEEKALFRNLLKTAAEDKNKALCSALRAWEDEGADRKQLLLDAIRHFASISETKTNGLAMLLSSLQQLHMARGKTKTEAEAEVNAFLDEIRAGIKADGTRLDKAREDADSAFRMPTPAERLVMKLSELRKRLDTKQMKKARDAAKKALSATKKESLRKEGMQALEMLNIRSAEAELADAIRSLLDEAASRRKAGDRTEFVSLTKAAAALKAVSDIYPITAQDLAMLADLEAEAKAGDRNSAKSARAKRETLKNRLEAAKTEMKDNEEQLEQMREAVTQKTETLQSLTVKNQSLHSRKAWEENSYSAVWSLSAQAKLLEQNILHMSNEEQKQVLSFIRDNAVAFRHTLRRKQQSAFKRRVDVKGTIRAATRTGGDPYRIKYQKPKKSHAKVVCLVDMSGSCRKASTLSLYFMALMNDVFPGGCAKFVFVNSLIPVDDMFRDSSPEDGVKKVVNTIPTRGVYSDYGTPIASLHDDYSGLFSKETTVLILGDARGNRRDPQVEKFKDICDKSRNVFWLNCDDVEKWNQGDSDIQLYEKAGAKVSHFACVGELLGFLTSISSDAGTVAAS